MAVPEALIRKRRVSDPALAAPPPPALKLVPPIVPRLDDAVAQPAISVPAPVTRPRYVGPEPDRLTRLSETAASLRQPVAFDDRRDETGQYANPDAYHTPSRGRAFLMGALERISGAVARAQQSADAQGRPVGWGDVARAGAESLGAGIGSALNPKSIVYAERDRQAAEVEGQYGQEFEKRGREAQLKQIESAPVLAAAKIKQAQAAAQAEAAEKQIDNLRDTWKHLPEYKRGDPRFAALDAEAERLGVQLPDFAKDRPPRNPVVREVDGKTFQYDDEAKAWVPAQGLPTEARIDVPGYGPMSPAAVYSADATREAGNVAAGTQYAVRATEAQNQNAQNAYRATLAERDEAEKAAKAANALHDELDSTAERMRQLAGTLKRTDLDAKARFEAESEYDALNARVPKIRTQMQESIDAVAARYGPHVEMGRDERFRVKPPPSPPSVVAPPPPQMRQGPRAAKSLTADAVRGMTEAEVRAAALAQVPPKDPEAAVAKWRKLRQ